MRAVFLTLFTAGLTIVLSLAVLLVPKPSQALAVAESIAGLMDKEGVHKVYISGIVVFEGNRIIVQIGDYSAEVHVNKTLSGAGSGLITIYVNKTHAIILTRF